jgi:hypothetical protein
MVATDCLLEDISNMLNLKTNEWLNEVKRLLRVDLEQQALHSIPSASALHQEQGNLERGTKSFSSTVSCRLLPL